MKNYVYLLAALLVIAFAINSCKKSELAAVPASKLASSSLGVDSVKKPKLTASQYLTSKDIPDTLTISGLSTKDSVHWSITPAGQTNILQKSKSRYVVSFETEGTYKIRAIVNNNDTLSASIQVDSASTTPPSNNIVPFAANDQMNITPSLYKSIQSDSSYLVLTAKTTGSYPCQNSQIYASWADSLQNKFNINFMGIERSISDICLSGPRPLSIVMAFPQQAQNPYLVNGTYPIWIVFKGTTYTGHIIVSTTAVTFDWNFTSGVVFTTKQISR